MAKLTTQLYQSLETDKYVRALFIDIRKAFDSISHKKLISKMINLYNVPAYLVKLLCNYLTNRHFLVKLGSKQSQPFSLNVGIIQGSILGPILFIIHFNDLCERLQDSCVFADDVGVVCKAKSADLLKVELERNLVTMYPWCGSNSLEINFFKTVYMLFNKPRSRERANFQTISCDGNTVQQVSEFKYLGLIIDKELKFEQHCNHVHNKITFKC